MDKINDGGPEFPTSNAQAEGMTLRDYFAAKAMGALIAGSFTEIGQQEIDDHRKQFENIEDLVASCSYEYADAMLKAREAC